MLKVGLIGCGFMGTMHSNCYKILPNVELVAVADIRAEKAEEIAQGTNAKIYADGKDLIREADVDIIDICLPTYLHAEYALLAMDKVRYLIVEKPVTLKVEEAEAMIKKSAQTGCRVQVGQCLRFSDEYTFLRNAVKEGRYGKVVNANFRRLSPSPDWGWNNWLHDVNCSGGAAQDLYIHDVDYVLTVFGRPDSLWSVKNTLGEKNSYINTLMKYRDFAVSIEGTWDLPASHPFQDFYRVVFEDAVLEYECGKLMLYTNDGAEEVKLNKLNMVAQGGTAGNVTELGEYYNELQYFVQRAAAGLNFDEAKLTDATESLRFLLNFSRDI